MFACLLSPRNIATDVVKKSLQKHSTVIQFQFCVFKRFKSHTSRAIMLMFLFTIANTKSWIIFKVKGFKVKRTISLYQGQGCHRHF